MTIDNIIEYVLKTPLNTNKAILTAMLEDLIADNSAPGGGYLPEPGTIVIFDAGKI